MTNLIQFPSSLSNSVISDSKVSKLSSDITTTGFNEMLSTFLSDMNSTSGIGDIDGSSSSMMTPLLLMLFIKLFGEDAANNLNQSVPQGAPVNGRITQESHVGHVAVDFGVPVGTSIKATMGGKVTYAGWNNEGYGNLVIVENGNYKTYYAHLSKIPVKVGQSIEEGSVIGLSGNTGNSTGPHLHYEIRKNGVPINPLTTFVE